MFHALKTNDEKLLLKPVQQKAKKRHAGLEPWKWAYREKVPTQEAYVFQCASTSSMGFFTTYKMPHNSDEKNATLKLVQYKSNKKIKLDIVGLEPGGSSAWRVECSTAEQKTEMQKKKTGGR